MATKLRAQTTGTGMGLTSAGRIVVPATSGFSQAEVGGLSKVATAMAQVAPNRAQATAAFNDYVSKAWANVTAPIASAASSVAAATYYLFDGAQDALLRAASGAASLEFTYTAGCSGMPGPAASGTLVAPDEVQTGVYNSGGSTSCKPVQVIKFSYAGGKGQPAGTSCAIPTEPAISGGGYSLKASASRPTSTTCQSLDVWYLKSLSANGGYVDYPPTSKLSSELTAAQKARVISEAALNAITFGAFSSYLSSGETAGTWGGGGFTGGGGGSAGGGGASGNWGETVGSAITGGGGVRGGVTGTTNLPGLPTLGDASTAPTRNPTTTTPPTYSYPSDPMFPDDPGYNGGAAAPTKAPDYSNPTTPVDGSGTGGTVGNPTTNSPQGPVAPVAEDAVDPGKPDDLPAFEKFTEPFKDVFKPLGDALTPAEADCPTLKIPAVTVWNGKGWGEQEFDYHCKVVGPFEGIIRALGMAWGGWQGLKYVMEA